MHLFNEPNGRRPDSAGPLFPTDAVAPALPTPMRGKRFSEPAADIVYAALLALPETVKREVELAMREHLCMPESERPDEQAVREARAIAALHEANRQLKAADPTAELSEAAYERLRFEQPERNWPSETSIRRWLGAGTGNLSWTVSVERAGLQPPAIPTAPRAHLGPRLTRAELEQAIRDYIGELGEPPVSFAAYSAWARRLEVRALPGRRPLSEGPFIRAFGGFRAALRTLGFADPAAGAPLPPRQPGFLPHGFRYTREQYLEALREVAAELGRSPRSAEYVAVRRRLLQKAVDAGRPRAMPSLPMFHRHFGGWDNALVEAGLQPLGGSATGAKGKRERVLGPRIPREQMLAAVQAAIAVYGPRLTAAQYIEWRRVELAKDGFDPEPPPSLTPLYQWFGRWKDVRIAAVEHEHPSSGEAAS